MLVTHLKIENFLTIGKASVNLDNKGLVLIQGDNRDDTSQGSNGAGKSSIADALCWALFGTTARGEGGDGVVNNKAGKGVTALVEVEIQDDGAHYKITRTRKKGKGDLEIHRFDGGGWASLSLGTMKLTQELIDKIIGCSADVFASAIYAGQEKMPDLPGMTDKMLKMLIEEAAGVQRIEQMYRIARDEVSSASRSLDIISSNIQQLEAREAQAKTDLATIQANITKWEETHTARVKDEADKLTQLKADMDVAKDAYEKLALEEPGLVAESKAINDRLARLSEYQALAQKAERLTHQLRSEVTRAQDRVDLAVRDARQTKAKLGDLDASVGKPCDACGKPYCEEDLESVRASLRKSLEVSVAEIKKLQADKATADEKLSVALVKAKEAADAIPDTSEQIKRRDEVSDALRRIEAARQSYQQASKWVRDKIGTLKAVKAEMNPHLAMREDYNKRLDAIVASLRDQTRKREEVEVSLAVKRAATQVFGPAGVRAHILDTVTPFLNDRTAHYLHSLTDGNIDAYWSTLETNAKGEIKEKFAISVKSKVGAHSFKGLSGGEKRKVRLACSMALQDLVSSRATKPIQLYVADEIDHALDEAGLERLMGILQDKASDRGTVLVISHNSLSDWISNSITVVKEGGRSRVEGVALA